MDWYVVINSEAESDEDRYWAEDLGRWAGHEDASHYTPTERDRIGDPPAGHWERSLD